MRPRPPRPSSTNTTVSFRAVDTAGNETTASYDVTNIETSSPDTTPPEKPVPDASSKDPTNSYVIVTATFSDDSVIRECSKDGVNWVDYQSSGLTFVENGTAYFRGTDAAGNESDIAVYEVTNIDKTAPTITGIAPSTTAPAVSVTVTANFADDVALSSKQYKIGDGAWTDYVDGVTVTENATVYFKAVDTAGNEATGQYEVTNIETSSPDTTKPVVSNVAASITTPTNQNVTVTADFSDDVALKSKLYKIEGDADWSTYPEGGVVVDKNTTVYFKAIDTSDNESDEASITITNIDKVKPTISDITPSTTEPTASVTVTAEFSDNMWMMSNQYKLGDGDWTDYMTGVTVTENTTIYFRCIDAAGNVSDIVSYDVTNISTEVPPDLTGDLTSTFDLTDGMFTSGAVVHTGTGILNIFSGGIASDTTIGESGNMYVKDGEAWKTTVQANGALHVSSRGYACDTIVEENGAMDVVSDGYASNTLLKGAMHVSDSVIQSTTVEENGVLYVSNGGYAALTTVKGNGVMHLSNGAIAYTTRVESNGMLHVSSGGRLRGSVSIADGGEIAFDGGIVAIDLTFDSPGTNILIDNIAAITGNPDYQIAVGLNSNEDGVYTFAAGAESFTGTMTLADNNYAKVGTLAIGEAIKVSGRYFMLSNDDGNLSLTISAFSLVPDNEPDDGTNDYLYKKKATPEWNDANIHVANVVFDNCEIYLDEIGTIDKDGKHNIFGNDGTKKDTGDVAKINVYTPAKLTFTIDFTAAGTFYVYEDGFDKKGSRKQITVGKVTVKAGQTATLKDVCLTATGKYYVAMTAKNTKANDKGSTFYNVTATLDPSTSSALAMPETDTLGISDALSFGQYDTDVLANASASALADLDDKSVWQSLLA